MALLLDPRLELRPEPPERLMLLLRLLDDGRLFTLLLRLPARLELRMFDSLRLLLRLVSETRLLRLLSVRPPDTLLSGRPALPSGRFALLPLGRLLLFGRSTLSLPGRLPPLPGRFMWLLPWRSMR